MEESNLLAEEQKEYRKRKNGTKDQLLSDKGIIRNCHTNLAVAWIDHRKACAVVLHSWMTEWIKRFTAEDGKLENENVIMRPNTGRITHQQRNQG